MGYKGTMRSLRAAMREAERESKRRQREYEKQAKELQKMQELERARFEVEQFENDIEIKISLHKEVSGFNWINIIDMEEPVEPVKDRHREETARYKLNTFRPRLIDKLFGSTDKKLLELEKKLEDAIIYDENEYDEKIKLWKEEVEEFESMQEIYCGISKKNISAYKKWFNLVSPFDEITELGSKIELIFNKERVTANINTSSIEIIPEHTKTLLKSGKLSKKNMSVSKRNDIYQDFVASESLRVAREIFEMIPVEEIIVNSKLNLLNKSNGYHEENIVLSVFYVKETIDRLNYNFVDPSDALSNFIYNMKFKRTNGFEAVQEVEINI